MAESFASQDRQFAACMAFLERFLREEFAELSDRERHTMAAIALMGLHLGCSMAVIDPQAAEAFHETMTLMQARMQGESPEQIRLYHYQMAQQVHASLAAERDTGADAP